MSDVSQMLNAWSAGNPRAAEDLLPLVYDELRRLAAAQMAREAPGQTLQATALVHEAYLKLVDGATRQPWENRRHFFIVAADAMRRILVDKARRKKSVKRGGGAANEPLDDVHFADMAPIEDMVALHEALDALAEADPDGAEVVKLRFFAGLEIEEIAEIVQKSRSTVLRNWKFARAWLFKRLKETPPNDG